jgi:hypothetical protein
MAFSIGARGVLSRLGLGNNVERPMYESVRDLIGNNASRLANFTREYERLRHIGESIDPERVDNAEEYAERYLKNVKMAARPQPMPAPAALSLDEEEGNWNYWHEGNNVGGGGGGSGGGGGGSSVAPKYQGFLVAKGIDGKSPDGRPQKQYQILNTEVSVLLADGGKHHQRIQRTTHTGISVPKDYALIRTLTIVGNKKDNIKDAYNAIVSVLEDYYKATIGKRRPHQRTQRKRSHKNQKTRKNWK